MEPSFLDVLMWVGLVALFLASILTLAAYGLQWLLGRSWGKVKAGSKAGTAVGSPGDPSEGAAAAALLSWLLSLESWNREWQKAWVTALNEEAAKSGSSLQLRVDKVGQHSSPLALSHVTSVIQSDQHLVSTLQVFGCHVTGEYIQFSISVIQDSPVAMGLESFHIQVSPLHIQLEIHIREVDVVQVTWNLVDPQNLSLKVTPRVTKEVDEEDTYLETIYTLLQDMLTSARPMVLLSMKVAPSKEGQNLPIPQNLPSVELNSQIYSPPKPPRAHERKLLVKIIKVDNVADPDIAESIHPYCVVELDNPVQKVTSSVMSSISNPLWDQQFVFELSAKSKKLHMQILEDGRPSENAALGEVTVPIDLFKKQPSGRQSFRLANTQNGNNSGSITAEFCYMEPNEVKCRQSPSLLSAKKVEKDRTVMPCGTVVTTVTAVKTKPRTDGKLCGTPTDSPVKISTEVKDADLETLAVGNSEQGAPVSKVLSSSDTELLQLSGTDPVAEAAIRQLTESARHALKSPIKKSTIVISGVTKAPLAVDDEMTLSADYAAAMDASLRQEAEPHLSSECIAGLPAEQTLTRGLPTAELCAAEGSSPMAPTIRAGQEFSQWNDGSQEDLDFEQRSNVSIGGSEAGTVKKSRGGFMRSGAKFFFRRRRHQKEPGMSQSHNDLVYLEQPMPLEKERKSARKHIKRLFPKSKSKAKFNSSPLD
ncbi:C2 domain-containing protein 2 isoform X1 [Carcharodon carcharias]|uniref:C2 domain-containing protein 2 isoform X1 n=1 Tax=Carcharodon carcharias TaxID=13397 RepID=UPI001B7DFD4F|nr:C2 domain-containing protein 2 isoform X1 [Carcharodon carcharias]